MQTVVVVPTYQEADNIVAFLTAVRTAVPDAHILIVDDNSPDGTGRMADEAAADLGNIHVLHRAAKQGLGSAYRNGFDEVLNGRIFPGQCDIVVSMDCDFSHAPAAVPSLIARIENGLDLRDREAEAVENHHCSRLSEPPPDHQGVGGVGLVGVGLAIGLLTGVGFAAAGA